MCVCVHRKGKMEEKCLIVYLPMCFNFNLFKNYFSMRNNYDG